MARLTQQAVPFWAVIVAFSKLPTPSFLSILLRLSLVARTV